MSSFSFLLSRLGNRIRGTRTSPLCNSLLLLYPRVRIIYFRLLLYTFINPFHVKNLGSFYSIFIVSCDIFFLSEYSRLMMSKAPNLFL